MIIDNFPTAMIIWKEGVIPVKVIREIDKRPFHKLSGQHVVFPTKSIFVGVGFAFPYYLEKENRRESMKKDMEDGKCFMVTKEEEVEIVLSWLKF